MRVPFSLLSQLSEKKFLRKIKHAILRYLGLKIRDKRHSVRPDRRNLISGFFKIFHMNEYCRLWCPALPGSGLATKEWFGKIFHNVTTYHHLICSRLYLSCDTRPDISFVNGYLTSFTQNATKHPWTAARSVLGYLKGTIKMGIT